MPAAGAGSGAHSSDFALTPRQNLFDYFNDKRRAAAPVFRAGLSGLNTQFA